MKAEDLRQRLRQLAQDFTYTLRQGGPIRRIVEDTIAEVEAAEARVAELKRQLAWISGSLHSEQAAAEQQRTTITNLEAALAGEKDSDDVPTD